jgi:hypothetical protein
MKGILALIPVLMLVVSGCATRPALQHERLLQITQGQTTRVEVEEMLGQPDDAVTWSNQKTLTVYRDSAAKQKFHLLKEEFDLYFLSAYFLFQPDGLLEKKLVSETATKTTAKFGVRTLGTPVTDEQLRQVKPKESRFEEVAQVLGQPIGEALTLDGQILREWLFVRQSMFSSAKAQLITGIFDYDTDVMLEYTIRDDVPDEKKKAVK